ncbi:hypothetical protein U9M48_029820 [Paspalum notatum var. saurae]|uniref:Uncharacterized protein n=1 Tax=Paspalum notatum var. saurae TaxID=547442 RepID=A0AAQ3X2L5_PASNO
MDRRGDGIVGGGSRLLAKLGVGFLTCSSAAAASRSRGDPGALAFVALAYGALLLLLYFLGRFERARPGDADRSRAKAAVWALSTLLTAMFAARVAPLMPPAVGVGVWAVAAATAGGGFWALFCMDLDRQGGFLPKLGFAVLTGNSALAVYRSRDDPSSIAFVVAAYAAIVLLFLFLRRFERGEGDRGRTKAAVWLLTTLLTVMFASRVAPLMPELVGSLVWLMAAATAAAGFWALMDQRQDAHSAWFVRACLGTLTLAPAVAVHRVAGDAASVAFVVTLLLLLLLLFAPTFVRPPLIMPSCFLWDYINVGYFFVEAASLFHASVFRYHRIGDLFTGMTSVMGSDHIQEKTELLYALINGRQLSTLPKVTQQMITSHSTCRKRQINKNRGSISLNQQIQYMCLGDEDNDREHMEASKQGRTLASSAAQLSSAPPMANNRHRDLPLAPTWATRAGFGFLTVNSALAIYKAWGDAVSIVFVSGSYLALLLLFRCLRDYEQAAPGSPARERARRAVWPLTTLLTVAFAWKVAAAMPSAVAAAVVWVLAVATAAGGFFVLFVPRRMDSLLTKLAMIALTCSSLVAAHRSWASGDPGALAFVALAYAALLQLLHFLRRFERAPPGGRGGAKAAVWALSTLLTAMFAARVAPLMPPAVGVAVWAMAAATAGGGFWALFLSH